MSPKRMAKSGRPCRDSRTDSRVVPIASPPVQSFSSGLPQMPGENHMGAIANHQVLAHRDMARKSLDFLKQAGRIDRHAGSDDALDVRAENAARDQRQLYVCPPVTTVCPH